MNVTNLYTNTLQEKGINTVCSAYERFHNNKPPIQTHFHRYMLKRILQDISFWEPKNDSDSGFC